MGHDWMFEVLADMRAYAERHGMRDLALKIDETAEVARREVSAAGGAGDAGGDPEAPQAPHSKRG